MYLVKNVSGRVVTTDSVDVQCGCGFCVGAEGVKKRRMKAWIGRLFLHLCSARFP